MSKLQVHALWERIAAIRFAPGDLVAHNVWDPKMVTSEMRPYQSGSGSLALLGKHKRVFEF
jgi:hypothetical protein